MGRLARGEHSGQSRHGWPPPLPSPPPQPHKTIQLRLGVYTAPGTAPADADGSRRQQQCPGDCADRGGQCGRYAIGGTADAVFSIFCFFCCPRPRHGKLHDSSWPAFGELMPVLRVRVNDITPEAPIWRERRRKCTDQREILKYRAQHRPHGTEES